MTKISFPRRAARRQPPRVFGRQTSARTGRMRYMAALPETLSDPATRVHPHPYRQEVGPVTFPVANWHNVGLGFDFAGLFNSASGLVKTGVEIRQAIRKPNVASAQQVVQQFVPAAAPAAPRPIVVQAPAAVRKVAAKGISPLMIGGIAVAVVAVGFLVLRKR